MPRILVAALLIASPGLVRAQAVPTPPTTAPSLPVTADDDSSKQGGNLAERLLVSPREPRCEDDGLGGIQVCGKKGDPLKNRLTIPGDLKSATDTNDGLPRAPDLMSNRIVGGIKLHGCLIGGCPPAMLPDINFRMIPQAPVGSDADLIGRGEIRGN